MKAIKKSEKRFTLFKNKWLYLLFTLLLLTVFLFNSIVSKKNIPPTPLKITLWVWERPENLYFMKGADATYAFLAGTVTKTDEGLLPYYRRQPLRIPDNSSTIAVVRIEDKSDSKVLSDSDLEQISDFVVSSCTQKEDNTGCQIDFDATQSQIGFYKELLVVIRTKLPPRLDLSITSLVSWCTTNDRPWFVDSPIDEVIPMFFRLGRDANIYWDKVAQGKLVLDPICQKSIGISTDEELPGKGYLKDKTIYIFNNHYWDESNWNIIKSGVENKLNEK